MKLTPKEIEKLMLHNAGFVAQKRYARGIKLNYPESIALIATQLMEFMREGASVSELMNKGKQILGLNDVMPGVKELLHDVQIEGTFPDGTKLVTVHEPISEVTINNDYALYGSGLTKSGKALPINNESQEKPGEIILAQGDIMLNEGRKTLELEVENTGDRAVQVGSHYMFAETNASLKFDRIASIGYRLDIPAGTAVRIEPKEKRKVTLVEIGGEKIVYGGNSLINGKLEASRMEEIIGNMKSQGYLL